MHVGELCRHSRPRQVGLHVIISAVRRDALPNLTPAIRPSPAYMSQDGVFKNVAKQGAGLALMSRSRLVRRGQCLRWPPSPSWQGIMELL